MALQTQVIINETDNDKFKFNITCAHHEGYLEFTFHLVSGTVKHVRRLRVQREIQHHHDSKALIGLNQRFGVLVDRIEMLVAENKRYTIQLADLRQSSKFSNTDLRWSETYIQQQIDYSRISEVTIDYEYDYEVTQLQINMYQQAIDFEQQRKSVSCSELEQKLKQSTDELASLRISYANLERDTANLYIARQDTLKQFEQVSRSWCLMKKQQKKQSINIRILMIQLAFFKNLQTYSSQYKQSASVGQVDVKQFYSFDLNKCVAKIRHDFELLYAVFYRRMTEHYQIKIAEVELSIVQTARQQEEMLKMPSNHETLQVEYDEMHKSYSYQKQIQIELEAKLAQLDSEWNSIQNQNQTKFNEYSKEIEYAQERIKVISFDIDDIRRCKKTLESEIIIYSHLLHCSDIEERVVIVPRPNIIVNQSVEENEGKRRGPIGFVECAANGQYIILKNHSTIDNIDISGWIIERHMNSETQIRHRLPVGIGIPPGKEFTVYSKLGVDAIGLSADNCLSSLSKQEGIVCNDLATWGTGNVGKTSLFDQNEQLKASFTQSVVLNNTSKN